MEYDASFSYVGHMEGEEYTYFWRGWKVNSWVEAFLPSDFVRMGKCFGFRYLHVSSWHAWFEWDRKTWSCNGGMSIIRPFSFIIWQDLSSPSLIINDMPINVEKWANQLKTSKHRKLAFMPTPLAKSSFLKTVNRFSLDHYA